MKKLSYLGIVLSIVVILSGCGKAVKNENSNQDNLKTEASEMQNQEDAVENEKTVVAKIKDAISSGKKMKCTYKISDSGKETEVITYMQGDKYRTEISLENMKTVSVFDGDSMYSWATDQKTGTKMTMDCINSLGAEEWIENDVNEENSLAPDDKDEFINTLSDTQNLSCEDAVDDIYFSIPSDIDFVDQCELLKSQQKIIEGLDK